MHEASFAAFFQTIFSQIFVFNCLYFKQLYLPWVQLSKIEASSQATTSFYHYKKVSLVLKCNRPEEVSCHRLCAVFSETETISRISYECFDRARPFNISNTSVNYSLRRSSWILSWRVSRNKLLARFVSIPTPSPKPYHVFTHFAVSVYRDMQ